MVIHVLGEQGPKRKHGVRISLQSKKIATEDQHKTYMDNMVVLGREITDATLQLVDVGKEVAAKLDQGLQTQIRIANSLERLEKHFTTYILLDPSEP